MDHLGPRALEVVKHNADEGVEVCESLEFLYPTAAIWGTSWCAEKNLYCGCKPSIGQLFFRNCGGINLLQIQFFTSHLISAHLRSYAI